MKDKILEIKETIQKLKKIEKMYKNSKYPE